MQENEMEKILLHIQLEARNKLEGDEMQPLLQRLKEALSTCLEKTVLPQDMTGLSDNTHKYEQISSQMLVVTVLPSAFLEILECLQTWAMHQKQCIIHVKAQCENRIQEGEFPVSMRDLADWLPFYKYLSL